jgi:DNA-directed RNA polymerase specialized sigma24 family protein
LVKIKDYVAGLTAAEYNKHLKSSHRLMRSERVEDVVQDCFIKLLSCEVETTSYKSYVGQTILNEVRRPPNFNARIDRYAQPIESFEQTLAAQSLDTVNNSEYTLKLLGNAIRSLKTQIATDGRICRPSKQPIIIKEVLQGKSLLDISSKYGLDYNSTKAEFRLAVFKIRKYMKEQGYQHGN